MRAAWLLPCQFSPAQQRFALDLFDCAPRPFRGSSIKNDIDQIAQAGKRGAEIEAATAGCSATLKYEITRYLPAIDGDGSQQQYMLMNVVTNAVEAVDGDDGTVTISARVMQARREYLAETYLGDDVSDGEFTYVEVADTGCGIDDEPKRRMFDPFFTTKFMGRGLGLAAVVGIVRAHHGCNQGRLAARQRDDRENTDSYV